MVYWWTNELRRVRGVRVKLGSDMNMYFAHIYNVYNDVRLCIAEIAVFLARVAHTRINGMRHAAQMRGYLIQLVECSAHY